MIRVSKEAARKNKIRENVKGFLFKATVKKSGKSKGFACDGGI